MRALAWLFVAGVIVFLLSGGVSVVAAAGGSDAVKRIARAIATAEGYFAAGSRPQKNNNPGNITIDNTGRATGRDGIYIVYAVPSDGWQALETQVRMMLNGGSRIYKPEMTITEVSRKWTTTQQVEWAGNVARVLGVSTETRLKDVV